MRLVLFSEEAIDDERGLPHQILSHLKHTQRSIRVDSPKRGTCTLNQSLLN